MADILNCGSGVRTDSGTDFCPSGIDSEVDYRADFRSNFYILNALTWFQSRLYVKSTLKADFESRLYESHALIS